MKKTYKLEAILWSFAFPGLCFIHVFICLLCTTHINAEGENPRLSFVPFAFESLFYNSRSNVFT